MTVPTPEAPEADLPDKSFISVIDDDQSVRESLRRLLRSLGYTVEAFRSAADFLAFPRLDQTTCLITDVQMPGMTGIELHKSLRGAGHAIPTILITAYPDDDARTLALKEGIICYLRKPLNEDDLIQCLRAATGSGTTDHAAP